ncbi:MAG: hypothetical protein DCC55_23565 [Chloroflexi bacterium]|nr:MAG: hypothetical protein DCC55_23565 [Chloroflexota bacterium]
MDSRQSEEITIRASRQPRSNQQVQLASQGAPGLVHRACCLLAPLWWRIILSVAGLALLLALNHLPGNIGVSTVMP